MFLQESKLVLNSCVSTLNPVYLERSKNLKERTEFLDEIRPEIHFSWNGKVRVWKHRKNLCPIGMSSKMVSIPKEALWNQV